MRKAILFKKADEGQTLKKEKGEIKMKKLLIVLVALTLAASFATTSDAAITGSKHDFSSQSWTSEICNVCHTPHDKGRASTTAGLMWNHDLTAATSYVMYDSSVSATLDGTVDGTPFGLAKLCLACHDGTTAVDSFGGVTGTVNISTFPGAKVPNLGTATTPDLRGTHPISIVYDNIADPGLKDPTITLMGVSGFISANLDIGNRVQCSTCHDVHNTKSVGNLNLLRVNNQTPASGLCLVCHDK